MSGVMHAIFGGKSSESQATSKPVDMTPDELKGLRPQFAGELSKQLTTGGPSYTGPLTADMTQNEADLLERLRTEGGTRRGLLEDTLAGKFLPGQAGSNPFLQAAITAAQRPTLEGLTEVLGRTLPGRFTNAGNFVQPNGSSAFDRAAGIATRGAANALGDIATNMSYGAYNDERTRQQGAIQLSQADLNSTIDNLKAQALPRLIQQAGIDKGIELFGQRTQSLMELLKILAASTSATLGNVQQSTSKANEDKGIIPAIAGTILLPTGAAR
jgi:hypothetical protein